MAYRSFLPGELNGSSFLKCATAVKARQRSTPDAFSWASYPPVDIVGRVPTEEPECVAAITGDAVGGEKLVLGASRGLKRNRPLHRSGRLASPRKF